MSDVDQDYPVAPERVLTEDFIVVIMSLDIVGTGLITVM